MSARRALPWFGGPDALRDLERIATPAYVYHGPTLDAAAARLRTLRSVDRVYYAQKANDHAGVLARLCAAGLGVECVSGAEVAHAVAVAPAAPRLFTPNFAPRVEYEAAYAAGAAVTVDAPYPLARWASTFAGREVLLRVDLGEGRGHHRHVRTAGGDAKFGLLPEALPAVVAAARAAGTHLVGLHAHSGSGIFEPATWAEHLAGLRALAPLLPAPPRVFDVGGGLGVPYGRGRPLDLRALDAALAEARRGLPPDAQVWIEAGRFCVAEAGILLTRVTQRHEKGGTLFVGVDASMAALIRPALYGARHPVVNLSRPAAPPVRVTVVGPVCESADVLARGVLLPEPQEGDLLALTHAGAYGRVMSSNYNRRSVAEVLWD